ncbi:hypothetical protein [Streptomyces sp. NPDC058247]|uniref:hypothetical protein n=1 Tax=Streptomyces sp. NPDC058247 TaxID=3346401 RepID=UPI0036EC6BB6
MARHSAKKSSAAQRALLRAGLTLTAAGAALGGGAVSAGAAEPAAAPLASPVGDLDSAAAAGGAVTGALETATAGGLAPVKHLRLNPLSGTGVDPLDNAVGTQVADFKPVTTAVATGPLTKGGALADLPLVGPATSLLPG